jgi:hypothetical protein
MNDQLLSYIRYRFAANSKLRFSAKGSQGWSSSGAQ